MEYIAHLRHYNSSKQCEILFDLQHEAMPIQKIRVNQSLFDTVSQTIEAIKKSVKEVIETNAQNTIDPMPIITACFKRNTKTVKGSSTLQQFIGTIPASENVRLIVCNQSYNIALNAPLLKQLKLPIALFVDFTIQPSKFHSLFTDHETSRYSWYKSKDKEKWEKVGKEYQYHIKEDDCGHYLKFCGDLFNKLQIRGPTVSVISDNVVESAVDLPSCPFEIRHAHTTEKLNGKQYRIVSYNILSERYVNENDFKCSPKVLSIDYRKQLIFKELSGYHADVMCLQEVDNFQYTKYYHEKFKGLGYEGIYNRKGNRISEGLACFYNKSRLKKIMARHIVFNLFLPRHKMFSYLCSLMNKNKDLYDLFMRQSTSLQVAVFKTNQPKKYLIVANTHLFYHPEADHIRLLQVNAATTYLNHIKKAFTDDGIETTVIFCGDFNSTPAKSAYEYMISGSVACDHKDMKKISEKTHRLYHKFVFESACGTPQYTNYTRDYKGCLDYIFIEKDKLDVVNCVPLTPVEELQKYEALPNEFFPSDHLALVVDVEHKY